MKKLRMAIVGCGDIARFMALGCRLNRGFDLCACVDVNPERARRFARFFLIPRWFTDYGAMLEQVKPSVVYLAVPHVLHRTMACQALDHGAHVFCEKPIAATLADGLAIVEKARLAGLKVGVNYQYRYDAGCYALAQAARSGALGAIRYARCNLPWHREDAYFSASPWHGSLTATGGGTLITQASHILDVLLWASHARPVAAMGLTARRRFTNVEVEDLAMGTVELSDGSLIEVTSSMVAVPEQAVTIELYGSEATACYRGAIMPRLAFKGKRIARVPPPVKGVHALFRSIEGFRRWVMEEQTYLTPGEGALPVLGAIEAVYRSAGSGRKERVDQKSSYPPESSGGLDVHARPAAAGQARTFGPP